MAKFSLTRRFIPLLLLICFVRTAWAKGPLTPEQVTDLLLKVSVNYDIDSAKKLNGYWRPLYSGEDYFDLEALKNIPEELKKLTSSNAQALVSSKIRTQIKPDTEKFASAYVEARRRTECHARGSELSTEEVGPNLFVDIATVNFECVVVDVGAPRAQSKKLGHKSVDAKSLQQLFQKFIDAYQNAPSRTISGSFMYYKYKKTDPWSNASAMNISSVVDDALSFEPEPAGKK